MARAQRRREEVHFNWGMGGRRRPVVRDWGRRVRERICGRLVLGTGIGSGKGGEGKGREGERHTLESKTASLALPDFAASAPLRPLGSSEDKKRRSAATPSDDDDDDDGSRRRIVAIMFYFGPVRFGPVSRCLDVVANYRCCRVFESSPDSTRTRRVIV